MTTNRTQVFGRALWALNRLSHPSFGFHLHHSTPAPFTDEADPTSSHGARERINVWVCDAEGRVTRILGPSRLRANGSRYLGKTDFDYLAPEDAAKTMPLKRRAIEEGRTVLENVEVWWHGRRRLCQFLIIPIFAGEGRPVGITCIAIDLSGGDQPSVEGSAVDAQPLTALAAAARALTVDDLGSLDQAVTGLWPVASSATGAGQVRVDEATRALRGKNKVVRLSRTEWQLLSVLRKEQGSVIDQARLIEAVWGPAYRDTPSLLHDAISRLRQRYRAAGAAEPPIETIYGVGYRLI